MCALGRGADGRGRPLHAKESGACRHVRGDAGPRRNARRLGSRSCPSHPEVQHLQHAARPRSMEAKVWPTGLCSWITSASARVSAGSSVGPRLRLGAGRHRLRQTVPGPGDRARCRRSGVSVSPAAGPAQWRPDRRGTAPLRTPDAAGAAAFDLIVGADICFWEDLVDPLYLRVRHSVAAGGGDPRKRIPAVLPRRPLCAVCSRAMRRSSPGPRRPPSPTPAAYSGSSGASRGAAAWTSRPGRRWCADAALEGPWVMINRYAQFIRVCRWLKLIRKGGFVPLENVPFSTPWARKRCGVAQRFHQY